MKVLVFGHSGQVATELRALDSDDIQITALARADADLTDPAACAAAINAHAYVYVGTERWGRGLDLRLCYVFVLSPPASTASYVHMAGRTGRQGAEGTCVTLLEHRQAPRLVAFAEALGVPFRPL